MAALRGWKAIVWPPSPFRFLVMAVRGSLYRFSHPLHDDAGAGGRLGNPPAPIAHLMSYSGLPCRSIRGAGVESGLPWRLPVAITAREDCYSPLAKWFSAVTRRYSLRSGATGIRLASGGR